MPKVTLILDLDDTLIQTSRLYYNVRDAVFKVINKECGLEIAEIERRLEKVEHENVRLHGFFKERFPLSLAQTYTELCEEHGFKVNHQLRHEIEGLGWALYDMEHPVLEGVEHVLGQLTTDLSRERFRLILCTKGDLEIQRRKLTRSGLHRYFEHIEIVPDKNIETYKVLSQKYGFDPEHAYMIGDSIKSDINPAMTAGLKAIYIPSPDAWSYEVEPLQSGHVTLTHICELLTFLRKYDAEHLHTL
jgi:putative hydrolase of the HAD superfamily